MSLGHFQPLNRESFVLLHFALLSVPTAHSETALLLAVLWK